LIAIALVAVSSCASSPAPTTYYLLRDDPVESQGPIDARIRVGVGRVVMAPYLLGSTGIMIETEPGEVRPATYHQWAEPLDAGLRWFIRGLVTSKLGFQVGGGITDIRDWDYRVDVFVSRMHATMDGRAILEAIFIVRSSESTEVGGAPGEYRFAKSVALPQEGYAGVVEAQRMLTRELADLIASALRERMEAASVAEIENRSGS
jgi:uncharacterized lipoprotein YmbA